MFTSALATWKEVEKSTVLNNNKKRKKVWSGYKYEKTKI